MDIRDIRLGGQMTLSGEVREMSMLTPDDKLLPEGVIDIRLRVVLADQAPGGSEPSLEAARAAYAAMRGAMQ